MCRGQKNLENICFQGFSFINFPLLQAVRASRIPCGGCFGRYLIMLYCMELYNILFFDWFLLCHSNFFPHFYPELKGIVGPHMFGYNKRTHILHFLLYIPLCAVIAGICMIF